MNGSRYLLAAQRKSQKIDPAKAEQAHRLESFPLKLAYFLHSLSCIPIYLTTDTSDYLDISSPQSHAGEEATDILHPIVGVVLIDEVDLDKSFLEVLIHPIKFAPTGQPGREAINGFVAC